jgi:hypothetical protein
MLNDIRQFRAGSAKNMTTCPYKAELEKRREQAYWHGKETSLHFTTIPLVENLLLVGVERERNLILIINL